MLTAEQEKAIVEACRTDPRSFEPLYDEYFTPIFGYVFRRVGDFDESRDLTSEVFLKAYSSIHSFKWKGISVSSWLYRIATNEVNSFFRKKRRPFLYFIDLRAHPLLNYPDPASLEAEKQEAERELARHQLFLKIQVMVRSMSPKYQAVLSLRFFEGKSVREVAEIVGMKEGTVKSLLSRGLERIRSSLNATGSKEGTSYGQ